MDKSNCVLFIDSNEELWFDKAEKLGCNVISMPYVINGETYDYWLGKDFDFKNFFDQVRKGIMPTTCALNPQDYTTYFEPIFASGKDIFYIHFSNKLSGTFQYMDIALDELAQKYPERKLVEVNTLSISMGAGMMVEDLAKMFNDGVSVEEIVKYAEEHKQNYSAIFTVFDLNHLKRGGRISFVSAFVGGILGIKPILSITPEGELKKLSQVNGRRKSISTIVSLCIDNLISEDKHPVYVLHADCENEANIVKEQLLAARPELTVYIQPVGPTVGTHCGPDTLAIAYYSCHR